MSRCMDLTLLRFHTQSQALPLQLAKEPRSQRAPKNPALSRKGSQKRSEKGACYGFYSKKKGSEKGSQKGFREGGFQNFWTRRYLECPLGEYAPLGVRPNYAQNDRKKGKDPHPQDKIQHLDFTKGPGPLYYKTPPCVFTTKKSVVRPFSVLSKDEIGP